MNDRSPQHFEQVSLEYIAALAKAPEPKILSVSADRVLAKTRSAILQQAGFQVDTAHSARAAARRLLGESYDVVMIGHSLPTQEKGALVRAARGAKSAPWIIGLYKLSATEIPGVHVAVDSHDPPEALVAVLRRFSQRCGPDASPLRPQRG